MLEGAIAMGNALQDKTVVVVGRRTGASKDVAGAVLFAMTNSFLSGVMLRIDRGEPLT